MAWVPHVPCESSSDADLPPVSWSLLPEGVILRPSWQPEACRASTHLRATALDRALGVGKVMWS